MTDDLAHFVAPEQLRTDRVLLRSWLPGDGAANAAAIAGSYEHLRAWLAWPEPAPDVAAQEQLVRGFRAAWLRNEDFTLAVLDAADGRVLGGSGLHLRDGPLSHRQAEIGMWVTADAAGRGLGTHVLVALLGWGFDAWPFLRLYWRCDTGNVASRRTAERAGMRLEGTLRGVHDDVHGGRRDLHVFAALRGEWAAPGEVA